MAEGDVIVELQFDDSVDPPFELGSAGAALYAAVAPLAYADKENGWPLARLCAALGRMRQPISDMVRAWEEPVSVADAREGYLQTVVRSGWSRAVHVDAAPGANDAVDGGFDMLPFLAQMAGVRGIERLSDVDRRAAIRERAGVARGRPRSILSSAERFTDGTPGAVILRERHDSRSAYAVDAPYRGRIVIKESRIRDLARVNLIANPQAAVDTETADYSASGASVTAFARQPWSANGIAASCYAVTGRSTGTNGSAQTIGLGFSKTGTQATPVSEGRPYTLSVWVLPSYAATGLSLLVRWFSRTGTPMANVSVPVTASGATRVSTTFTPPAGAAYGQFGIQQTTTVTGTSIGFRATAALLERGTVVRDFADALTSGWTSIGPLHASPSKGPGVSLEEIAASVLSQVPAGLVYDIRFADMPTYAQLAAANPTYNAVNARYLTFNAVLES